MIPLLLPGTLCDAALWAGVALPDGAWIAPFISGESLEAAAGRALDGAPPRLHVVGFSLGAIVAFELLRRFSGRVARLTLLSANPREATDAQRAIWADQERRTRAGQFAEVAGEIAMGAGANSETMREMAARIGPDVFLQQLALLRSRPDSRETLRHYRGPLTLLVGEHDAITPPSLTREMAASATQAEVRVIPGAGHYLPLDAPHALENVLREVIHA